MDEISSEKDHYAEEALVGNDEMLMPIDSLNIQLQNVVLNFRNHAAVLVKQINELRHNLAENNVTIESLNKEIQNFDEAIDLSSYLPVMPDTRRKLTDNELTDKLEAILPPSSLHEELDLMVEHVPQLKIGVDRLEEAIVIQSAIISAQRETLDSVQHYSERRVLGNTQVKPADNPTELNKNMLNGLPQCDVGILSLNGSGIRNYGNTCYMNAVVQSLFHLPSLMQRLLQPIPNDSEMILQLLQLLKATRIGITGSIENIIVSLRDAHTEIINGKQVAKFVAGVQCDAYDFLSSTLEKLREEIIPKKNKADNVNQNQETFEKNVVHIEYEFSYKNFCRCDNCAIISVTENTAISLTITLGKTRSTQDVQSLVDRHFKAESGCKLRCTSCNQATTCSNRMQIMKTSPILIVHIKRFRKNKDGSNDKNESEVLVQEKIYVTDGNGAKTLYKLKAMILHVGGLSYGHYTAVVLNATDEWVLYNDDKKTRTVRVEEVDRVQPYILFYEKETETSNEQNDSRADVLFDDDDDGIDDITHNNSDENADWQPFIRNTKKRSTPVNIKRRVKSDGKPLDINANIPLTSFRHKKVLPVKETMEILPNSADPPRAQYRKLFTDEQEAAIDAWLFEEREGDQRSLRRNSIDKLTNWIHEQFNLPVTRQQVFVWNKNSKQRLRKTGKGSTSYTEEQRNLIHEMKVIRKMSWCDIETKYNEIHSGLHRNIESLRYALRLYQPSPVRGRWTSAETNLLLEEFQKNGTNWSTYKIDGRHTGSIQKKFSNLLTSAISKMNGQSFTSALMNAFDLILSANKDDDTVEKEQWFEKVHELVPHIELSHLKFFFKQAANNLIRHARVVTMSNGTFKRGIKEASKYIRRLPIYKPMAPLRSELTDDERDHINKLIYECEREMKKNNGNLTWFGSQKFKVIATTTNHPQPRELKFQTIGSIFDDDKNRRALSHLLYGKGDDDSDEDEDDDDEDDEDILREATNEIIDIKVENAERGIRVLGLIPIKSSNDATKKSLFFFTRDTDIIPYIRRQLIKIFTLKTCPSWIEAFATTQSEIDWNELQLLAVAQGYTAALRLKLTTVSLTGPTSFNVRKSIYPPITDGATGYIETLINAGVHVDETEIKRMQNRYASNSTGLNIM